MEWLYCGCSLVLWLCTTTAQYRLCLRVAFIVFHSPPACLVLHNLFVCLFFKVKLSGLKLPATNTFCQLYFYIWPFRIKTISCLSQTLYHCEEKKEGKLGHDVTGKLFSETHSSLKWVSSSLWQGEARFFAGCISKLMCLSDPCSWHTENETLPGEDSNSRISSQ